MAACTPLSQQDPYQSGLCTFVVNAQYPDGFDAREGIAVGIEEVNLGNAYSALTDASGKAEFKLPLGLYRISISDVGEEDIFNGTLDKVRISDATTNINLPLMHSRAGSIIIKEIYCGGCKKAPIEGGYAMDKYVIVHNNDPRVQYLDGLCFGMVMPYNSTSTNNFVSIDPETQELIYPDYVPIATTIWQFGGSGNDFPLQPGEDAVIALNGAIDHSAQYPLSVNLNVSGYWVCYNNNFFPNTTYHPAPGDQIALDHYLDALGKFHTGSLNAYPFSQVSPTALLFKAQGMTMREYLQQDGIIMMSPGSTQEQVAKMPLDWFLDAVEVFDGGSSKNAKRLQSSLDAGYATLSDTFLGHTLMRKVDEALSASSGYEVLVDTNNSKTDFYERETQSLHHE